MFSNLHRIIISVKLALLFNCEVIHTYFLLIKMPFFGGTNKMHLKISKKHLIDYLPTMQITRKIEVKSKITFISCDTEFFLTTNVIILLEFSHCLVYILDLKLDITSRGTSIGFIFKFPTQLV